MKTNTTQTEEKEVQLRDGVQTPAKANLVKIEGETATVRFVVNGRTAEVPASCVFSL